MQTVSLGPELRAAAPAIALRLATILLALGALIARGLLKHRTHQPAIVPLWNYLGRTARRFARVMSRLAAGTLRTRKSRPGRPSSGKPPVQFPRNRAWLIAELKHEAVAHALHLEKLLGEPETAAILAATPQAQRLLRPICHLLGIKPKAIQPPSPALAGEGRGPSRSVGKGEGRATRRTPPAPPILEPAFSPRPVQPLCPRLLTRWPWNAMKNPA